MKFNNKILGIIFIALLAILLLRKTINKPEVRSFREILVTIDTAIVDKIILTKGIESRIELQKENDVWTAASNGIIVPATINSVKGLLTSMVNIKPQQLISKKKDKWAEYELDDDSGKKVEIYADGKLMDAFYTGRFNFDQQNQTAKTFLRKADEADVYSVDGFLSMTLDKNLNDFRNKKLFNGLQKNRVKSISYKSKSSSQNISFDTNQWLNANNLPLDSIKVENYLTQLISKSGSQIDDDFVVNMNKLEGTIQLMSENNNSVAEVNFYIEAENTKPFVFHSSLNEGVYFRSDSTNLYQSLVKGFLELD